MAMIILLLYYSLLFDFGITKLPLGLKSNTELELRMYSCVYVLSDNIVKQNYIPLYKQLPQFISVVHSSGYRPELLEVAPRSVIFLADQTSPVLDVMMRDTQRHLIIMDDTTGCDNMKPSQYDVDYYCFTQGRFVERYYAGNKIVR